MAGDRVTRTAAWLQRTATTVAIAWLLGVAGALVFGFDTPSAQRFFQLVFAVAAAMAASAWALRRRTGRPGPDVARARQRHP